MSRLKKEISTVGVIISILLCTFFYLMYQEYEYTYTVQERFERTFKVAERELTTSIYKALKRETQTKVNKVAENIRSELLNNYNGNLNQFAKEYDYPEEDSILVTTIDDIIHNKDNRFYYIESDSNDMFVSSKNGIVSDKSQDCSVFGITRTYDEEISMHFNQSLANQAIEGLMMGNELDIFWRFKNTSPNKDVGLTWMNIEDLLGLSLQELKDYEFLSVAYIDKYGDILGIDDVSATGKKQDSRKLMIVQGFSLYEQIQEEFKDSYVQLEKKHKLQIALIEENRLRIIQKLIVITILIFSSFFSMAIIQNYLIKSYHKEN